MCNSALKVDGRQDNNVIYLQVFSTASPVFAHSLCVCHWFGEVSAAEEMAKLLSDHKLLLQKSFDQCSHIPVCLYQLVSSETSTNKALRQVCELDGEREKRN